MLFFGAFQPVRSLPLKMGLSLGVGFASAANTGDASKTNAMNEIKTRGIAVSFVLK